MCGGGPMKGKWLVPLLLVVAIGAAGFGLTGEKAQKVQKINMETDKTANIGCGAMGLNPLRCEVYPELTEAVKEYYAQKGREEGFIEAYDDIRVYTKLGKYTGSYLVFATYEMKIKDIYTKVPGLATLYAEKNGTSGTYEIQSDFADSGLKEYVAALSTHEDVQALLEQVNKEYEAALDSDALLREALLDLKNAYEEQSESE